MGSSSHQHRSFAGFIVFFVVEGWVGRDIPFDASFEVQELTGARGREREALGLDAVTEGGGEGEEVVISLSSQDMKWWKVVQRKLAGSKT